MYNKQYFYKIIIYTFIITALWDVVLNYMSRNTDILPDIINKHMSFIKDLKPYFEHHTVLAAALIAGFVGATTQPIILSIVNIPRHISDIPYFLLVTFIISALYGFIMKWSRLFPYLEKYYYNKLGLFRSLYHDGISGIIVQCTLIVFLFINKSYIKYI